MKRQLLGVAAILLSISTYAQDNPLWMRYCAISPDGTTIAFTYKGDIYTVPSTGGRASQITTNPAHDTKPIWSPDGKKIAFASDRMGSMDIFEVNKEGGIPKRLTTHSGNETPVTYKDAGHILFLANIMPTVEDAQFPSGQFQQVYEVNTEGGRPIPDDREYALYNNGIADRGDWRRYNVNLFVKEMGEHVHKLKPWVKFGVSPFGIYRNKKSSPIGSDTNGLQNYDQLYADVLLWVNNGWIDYCVPQLYWHIGHPLADYEKLIKWWAKHMANRPLYIGESIENTVQNSDPANPNTHQMAAKFSLHRQLRNVSGTVLWYAKVAAEDIGSYGTMLRNVYWKSKALPPYMPFLDSKAPKKPAKVGDAWTEDGLMLYWSAPKAKKWGDEARRYVIYRFAKGEKVNLADASKIVEITYDTYYRLPYDGGTKKYKYVVTALDRVGNESKGAKRKVKL